MIWNYNANTLMIMWIRSISFVKMSNLVFLAAILVASGLKMWLFLIEAIPFNGDEAVVALMGRHILSGARPIFFYGQAYMGSLDAWLVAAAFILFSEQVLSIRIIQMILYILYLLTLWLLAKRFFRDDLVPFFVIVIASIPPVFVTTYTSASLGGYGEILVLGNMILLLGYEILYVESHRRLGLWSAFGLISGVAFWTLGMAGVYIMPLVLLFMWYFQRQWFRYYFYSFIGFLIGSAPWWIYNLTNDWTALRFLFEPTSANVHLNERIIGFFLLGIPTLMGLRFPWSPEYSSVPILTIGISLFATAVTCLYYYAKSDKRQLNKGALEILFAYISIYFLLFIISGFGIDATGRRLLPLYLLVTLFLGWFVSIAWRRNKFLGIVLIVLILSLNSFETLRAVNTGEKLTTQIDPITRFDNQYDYELMDFLSQRGEFYGYTNYWVSFRLAFLSKEKIIYAAQLPYKANLNYSPYDNRYPGYAAEVAASSKVAFITSKHQVLDDILRTRFSNLDVRYSEAQIGVYHVFYDLSRKVHPNEVGLGVDSQ